MYFVKRMICLCLKLTCVQFPPVDLAEEGMHPDLVTCSILEAEPLVDLFGQQTLADGPGVLTEVLWIYHCIIQDSLLYHLFLHLETTQRAEEICTLVCTQVCTFKTCTCCTSPTLTIFALILLHLPAQHSKFECWEMERESEPQSKKAKGAGLFTQLSSILLYWTPLTLVYKLVS